MTRGPGVTGRLAPTPSGHLHLGNVTAFTAAWLSARSASGRLLLRFEDLDLPRARPDVEESQRRDLAWLGLHTDAETPRQSARSYDEALACLAPLTYRCTCTRAAVRAAGGRYPGTCRTAGHPSGAVRLRLPDAVVRVRDRRLGAFEVDLRSLGDPVLVRADGVVGYTLAVVVDDVRDGVDEVVRGADLAEQAAVHEVLWRALAGRIPTWLHAPLVLGRDGRKLSKSHGSTEIRALRDAGWTPGDVRAVVLPWLGLPAHLELHEAAQRFDPVAGPRGPVVLPEPLTPPASGPLPPT